MIWFGKESRMWILYVGVGCDEKKQRKNSSDESGKRRKGDGFVRDTPLTLNLRSSPHSDRKNEHRITGFATVSYGVCLSSLPNPNVLSLFLVPSTTTILIPHTYAPSRILMYIHTLSPTSRLQRSLFFPEKNPQIKSSVEETDRLSKEKCLSESGEGEVPNTYLFFCIAFVLFFPVISILFIVVCIGTTFPATYRHVSLLGCKEHNKPMVCVCGICASWRDLRSKTRRISGVDSKLTSPCSSQKKRWRHTHSQKNAEYSIPLRLLTGVIHFPFPSTLQTPSIILVDLALAFPFCFFGSVCLLW